MTSSLRIFGCSGDGRRLALPDAAGSHRAVLRIKKIKAVYCELSRQIWSAVFQSNSLREVSHDV